LAKEIEIETVTVYLAILPKKQEVTCWEDFKVEVVIITLLKEKHVK